VPPESDSNWNPLSITGPQGPPGEVTMSDLLANSAANVNALSELSLTISHPPTQAEVQAVVTKLNELIGALKRV